MNTTAQLDELVARRAPDTAHLATQLFDGHPHSAVQQASRPCFDIAVHMIGRLPDGPELTAGLRKLLEARDCFVRATLATYEVPF